MGVGTIGYLLILYFNDDPSVLKSSWALTLNWICSNMHNIAIWAPKMGTGLVGQIKLKSRYLQSGLPIMFPLNVVGTNLK